MALGFVVMAFVLEKHPPRDGSLFAVILASEPVHLVAHSVLYGGLAVALAAWCFPTADVAVSRAVKWRRALFAGACFVGIAGAQECVQALSRQRLPGPEEGFDLAVDSAAATLGLIAWARIPIQMMPAGIVNPGLMIFAQNSGASATENEERVARIVEEELRTLPAVEEIESQSGTDSVEIFVQFEASTDMNFAKAEVRDRIERARGGFAEHGDRLAEVDELVEAVRDQAAHPVRSAQGLQGALVLLAQRLSGRARQRRADRRNPRAAL